MHDKTKERIARRLTDELPDTTETQIQRIGDMVYTVAFNGPGHDVEFLLGVIDPSKEDDETIRRAGMICLEELAHEG